MSSMSLSHRRRAIYTGLNPFLPDDRLQLAIRHWEAQYADQPSLALQRFVADICRDAELKTKRSTILRQLLQTMAQPEQELLADPGSSLPNNKPGPSAEADHAYSVAFGALLSAMMALLPDGQQHKQRLEFFSALRKSDMPARITESLQHWLSQPGAPLLLYDAPKPMLRSLLNQFYVVLCEAVGPVSADRILATAAKQVGAERPELGKQLDALL